jgi:uncharacterized protein YbcC (UPF0753/DUF2309 family)
MKGLSERVIRETLDFFGVPREERASTIRATLLDLRGWAGMFRRMEVRPNEQPNGAVVRLVDFCAVQMILTRSSMVALAKQSGFDPTVQSFSSCLKGAPLYRNQVHEDEVHPSSIAFVDQSSSKREELEAEFEAMLVSSMGENPVIARTNRPKMQLLTCIDDRECSFRRHVEMTDPNNIETFGVAGFFGLPLLYRDNEGHDPSVLAPDGLQAQGEVREDECSTNHDQTVKYHKRRRIWAEMCVMWEKMSFSPIGSLFLSALLPLSLARIMLMGFSPRLSRSLSERLRNAFMPKPQNDFRLPFTAEKAAALLAKTFKDIGIHRNFAPVVIVLGHGSVSVNNPFAAAYNCGACGGREGDEMRCIDN